MTWTRTTSDTTPQFPHDHQQQALLALQTCSVNTAPSGLVWSLMWEHLANNHTSEAIMTPYMTLGQQPSSSEPHSSCGVRMESSSMDHWPSSGCQAPMRTSSAGGGTKAAATADCRGAADESPLWRSSGDVPERLVVARAIIQLIKRRGMDRALGNSLPDVVSVRPSVRPSEA